jgi:hypothetical protein
LRRPPVSGAGTSAAEAVSGSAPRDAQGSCERTIRRDRCEVSFDIRVPGSTAVEVKLTAGAVDVRDLRVETTAGTVDASDLRSQHVDVRTEAGAVTLAHAVAQASARSDAVPLLATPPADAGGVIGDGLPGQASRRRPRPLSLNRMPGRPVPLPSPRE